MFLMSYETGKVYFCLWSHSEIFLVRSGSVGIMTNDASACSNTSKKISHNSLISCNIWCIQTAFNSCFFPPKPAVIWLSHWTCLTTAVLLLFCFSYIYVFFPPRLNRCITFANQASIPCQAD